MNLIEIIINISAYFIFAMAPLFVCLSRNNIIATSQISLYPVVYLIPLFVIDWGGLFDLETISLLTRLNFIGALSLLLGIAFARILKIDFRSFALFREIDEYPFGYEGFISRIRILIFLGGSGMFFSFLWMKNFPLLAEDPFSAKFFKGDYKYAFDQISIIYRFSQFVVISLLPFGFWAYVVKKDFYALFVSVYGVCMLVLALNRSPALDAVLLVAAAYSSKNNIRFLCFLILSFFVYSFGSASFSIFGISEIGDSYFSMIAAGVPDIFDQLNFLSCFSLESDQSYGLTFVGGMVPGNFKYNPSVFSLTVVNGGVDISDIASGGFRMPVSIWGYVAFGWVGVVVVPFLSGFLIGGVKFVFMKLKNANFTSIVFVAVWYKLFWSFIVQFYTMYYFSLIGIFLYFWIFGHMAPKISKKHVR